MINKDRIVPVTATDLLTLYGLILKIGSVNVTKLEATNTEGDFAVAAAGTLLANEPVKTLDFASDVSTASVYFVPAYDYEGFKINGTAVTPTGTVEADGRTLYLAALSSGAVTITKIGF